MTMHYSKSRLLGIVLAAGSVSLGSALLPAQPLPEFEYLLTEANVTLNYTLTASRTSPAAAVTIPGVGVGSRVATSADTFAVTNLQVLRSLQLQGLIPPTPAITAISANGWELVAVRPPASDIAFINGRHDFYAINRNVAPVARILVTSLLSIDPKYSTHAYTERSIGLYPISGNGTTLNYVELRNNIQVVRTGTSTTYTVNSLSWGNAALTFTSIDEPVFYFPINQLSLSAVGEFSGSTTTPTENVRGLITLNFSIGTPRLVAASDYPLTDVDNVETNTPFNAGP